MTVRITPRAWPHRTDLYSGVVRVTSDGATMTLVFVADVQHLPLATVAEIDLDEDPGYGE